VTTYSGIDANGNATTVAAAASLGVSVTTTPPSGATAGLLTQGAYNLTSLGTGNSTQVSSANASAMLTAVGAALQAVTSYSALIGATQDRMTAASTLNSALMTNYALGVSALVDADMNVASTRLQALQTQQQLGIQSLSIANQNSQLILKLFQRLRKSRLRPRAEDARAEIARGEGRARSTLRARLLQAISEIALGIDGIVTHAVLQLPAQLADMALDDVFIDVFIENAVDRVENLRLGKTPAAVSSQTFENAPLSSGQRQRRPAHFGLPPVEKNHQIADRDVAVLMQRAAADRPDPGEDFPDMHRLPQDIVDAGREQTQGVVERGTLLETDHRRPRAFADQLGKMPATLAVPDQERLDGLHVGLAGLAEPVAELGRIDAGVRHAFSVETRRISPGDDVAVVYNDIHAGPIIAIMRFRFRSSVRTQGITDATDLSSLGSGQAN
jgi:hypothetical protein